tara:strand:+ start:2680 stop:3063 length:384 start_codon:yes stop_codon:yes gene_type:complete
MINHDVVKEFLLEKRRWQLQNYEAVVVTNKETWGHLKNYFMANVAGWELNVRHNHLVASDTLGSIRFLDVKNVTLKDIQMFTCASQNSTVILDIDYESGYRGGSEGVMYLISRMRSKASCHSRLVIV